MGKFNEGSIIKEELRITGKFDKLIDHERKEFRITESLTNRSIMKEKS